MRLQELAASLDLRELTPSTEETARNDASDITQGYASDLLSDVLAHAPAGGILVTLQVPLNVIAVAGIAGLRAVIFSCNRAPDEDAIAQATEEGLSLYVTPVDTFDVVGRLYSLGIRGGTPAGCQQRGVVVEERAKSCETEPDRSAKISVFKWRLRRAHRPA